MTSPSSPSTTSSPAAPAQVLDPRTLGRPVHLLPRLCEQFGQGFDGWLQRQFNRRYGARFSAGVPRLVPYTPAAASTAATPEAPSSSALSAQALPSGRWLALGQPGTRVACYLERPLVLSVMAYRYGTGDVGTGAEDFTPPETSTEERLYLQLLRQIAAQALSLLGLAALPFADESVQQPQPHLNDGSWLLEIPILRGSPELQSRALCLIEPRAMDVLLRRLAPPRPAPVADAGAATPTLPHLPLKLHARLLKQEMTLGDLLDLKPGDVVPVRLKRTEVLVDESCLFTASVAEHQGKLCLTSFSDAD